LNVATSWDRISALDGYVAPTSVATQARNVNRAINFA
jgi:hypothetical protein